MRVLVDTSVWSLALRRRRKDLHAAERALVLLLREMIIAGDVLMPGIVRQELLTGISDPDMFESLRQRLRDFDDAPPETDDYERAAAFTNECTRHGIAATPIDMLIYALAVGRDVPVLTTDADFRRYARHVPVRLYPLPQALQPEP